MAYGFQLFGYRRKKVDRRVSQLEESVKQAQLHATDLANQLKALRAENEELQTSLASMRRLHVHLASQSEHPEAVMVMVGPTDTLSPIVRLIDAIDEYPDFSIRFRFFRDGFYRVDGFVQDKKRLLEWLQSSADVHQITVEEETIHVVPKGFSA